MSSIHTIGEQGIKASRHHLKLRLNAVIFFKTHFKVSFN